jgi:hypothetical protein
MRSAAVAFVLGAVVAGGCLSMQDPLNLEGTFYRHQRSFSADVRWGQWDQAADYVEPASRARFDELVRQLAEFRVTDYEVQDVQLDASRTSAIAVVRYSGYELSMPVERQLTVTQRWRFDEKEGRWYVTPDMDLTGRLGEAGLRSGPTATP